MRGCEQAIGDTDVGRCDTQRVPAARLWPVEAAFRSHSWAGRSTQLPLMDAARCIRMWRAPPPHPRWVGQRPPRPPACGEAGRTTVTATHALVLFRPACGAHRLYLPSGCTRITLYEIASDWGAKTTYLLLAAFLCRGACAPGARHAVASDWGSKGNNFQITTKARRHQDFIAF
jgi:hypothetical protein